MNNPIIAELETLERKLAEALAENERLRKAMDEAQKQKPIAHAVYQGCLSGAHVSMLASAPEDFSGYLYAAPVPVQSPASRYVPKEGQALEQVITTNPRPSGRHRNEYE